MSVAASTPIPSIPSRTEAIAERVVADIRHRGLVSGDRYLTAEEARDCFGVGKNLINDALKLLAERGILIRKQRSGTFIGPRFVVQSRHTNSAPPISIVHVLMPMGYYRSNVIPGGVFVDQLSKVIPGSSVQIHHVADKDLSNYSLDLIARLQCSGATDEALVLLRSSREAQLAVQESRLPAIVFGSTYPDVKRLCSIDPDQTQAGRLAVKEAIARGHKQFALIMRNNWRRGDNLLMEGMSQALGEAGIGVDKVRMLSTAEDASVIEHDVAELLASDTYPTALICRSRYHAAAAIRGVHDRGLEPMKDVLVISAEASAVKEKHVGLSVVASLSAEQQVEQVGQLLVDNVEHGIEGHCIRVPVHVEEAGDSDSLELTSSPHSLDRYSRLAFSNPHPLPPQENEI